MVRNQPFRREGDVFVLDHAKLEAEIACLTEDAWKSYKNPLIYDSVKPSEAQTQKWLETFEITKPILSYDYQRSGQGFTIYEPSNPSEPWLTVAHRDAHYAWLFHQTFLPATGSTPFAVTDLKALAASWNNDYC